MNTLVRKIDIISADAVAIPGITEDYRESMLLNHPNLKYAWRANSGFETSGPDIGWKCRKSDAILRPALGTYLPAKIAPHASYNNRAALDFNTAAGQEGAMIGPGLFPNAGSFTVMFYGRGGSPAETAFMLGTGDDPGGTAYFALRQTNTGGLSARMNPNPATSPTLRLASAGPTLMIAGWNAGTGSAKIMVHTDLSPTVSTAGNTVPANGNLIVGNAGTPGVHAGAAITDGEVAEVLVFNIDLFAAGNESLLAAARGMVVDYYAIA